MWPRRTSLALAAAALAGTALLVAADAPTALAGTRDRSVREDLRFAAEMAEKGLWREALFRWRRVLDARPDDPALHNNIAVALEALGDRDAALVEYEASLAIASSERVRMNYELARRAEELSKEPDEEADLPLSGKPGAAPSDGGLAPPGGRR